MSNKQKENAVVDFVDMIIHSWTYERMTAKEQSDVLGLFAYVVPCEKAIVGSYQHRWAVCQAVYSAYLTGLGYTGMGWRDPNPEKHPKF